LFVHYGGPVTLAQKGYEAFKAPPPGITSPGADLNRRLFSFSGNGRYEMWRIAWDDYEAHPVAGSGAGTYERYWLRDRPIGNKVRDAHGLYVETLAELGPPGAALLVAVLAVPLLAAARARRYGLIPAAFGAYVAYVAHAGVDWDWEMTAVTLTGLFCGCALLVGARGDDAGTRPLRPILRAAGIVVTLALATFAFVGLRGNLALSSSQVAAEAGNGVRAEADARTAMRWAPWSSDALAMLAQAQLVEHRMAAARRSLRKAIQKNPNDWNLWYRLSLIERGREARRALAEAARLNPREPQIVERRESLRSAGS
jgi:tetratricopeptide (TPR) repeat protein